MIILTALFTFCSLAFADAAPPTKIALINMQEAIRSTADGKKAEQSLRKEMDDLQKKLQGDGKKIQDSMEELRKQAMVMDEKTRRDREEAIQQQIMKLREAEAQSQMRFQKRDQEVTEPIVKRVRDIVAQLSKERGYSLVMDGSNVVFAQNQDDITAEVIKRYDAKK
jgi:outer membrane protein